MHDRTRQLRDRLWRLAEERIRPAVIAERRPLDVAAWTVPGRPGPGGEGEPVPVARGLAASYRHIHPGTDRARWGAPWTTTWFRIRGAVPRDRAGRHMQAVIDLGFHGGSPGFQAEGLLYDASGRVLTGLHPRNHTIELTQRILPDGTDIHWYVEAAGNPDILSEHGGNTHKSDPRTADRYEQYTFARADLVIRDDDVYHLLLDLEVLGALAEDLDGSTHRRARIVAALERAADAIDVTDVAGTAAAARAVLAPELARRASEGGHRISAIGHAHIDTAWLWPLRETARKAARTFANVLDLMDGHPELVFAGPQAQQYAWVKARHPDLFERIGAAVARGQWVPVGGAWVEADGNLPGAEALSRQLVYGKRYFRDEFGVDTRGVWLPDSFGYTAAYPQIAALAGNDWFLTQKLSWNDTNQFPHHTLWWEGIDGTRILTHFPPADTYNGAMEVPELRASEARFRDKGWSAGSLYPFGYGDGGGGPTEEMLQRYARVADLDGMPRVVIESPEAFVARARAELEQVPNPPVWRGELYLELHRGTFTTQARSKAWNRRVEHLLREAELWATTAVLLARPDAGQTGAPTGPASTGPASTGPTSTSPASTSPASTGPTSTSPAPTSLASTGLASAYRYPAERLDRLWRTVLTLQFHDILPGSSITWVHRDAEATYARVAAWLEEIIAEAAAAMFGPCGIAAGQLAVLNASPFSRREVIVIDAEVVVAGSRSGGHQAPQPPANHQILADSRRAVVVEAPAGGVGGLSPATLPPAGATESDDGWLLDNGLVRVAVDRRGVVTSCHDHRADRELVPHGMPANLLQAYPDTPSHWDAWDLDEHYRHRVTDLVDARSVELIDAGPLQASIRVLRAYRASTITQTLRLRAGSPRLDIDTHVDWQERDTVLKAAFPLDLLSDTARSEIQYGHVTRATHENTSWDAARFESYAHRWVHVGEGCGPDALGVALVTDSTYGHDVRRVPGPDGRPVTVVRLTLLRSPSAPDPDADRGEHRFGYALVAASLPEAIEHGYAVNLPLRAVSCGGPAPPPLIGLEEISGGVIVEAVKLADDGSGDLVVRLYEGYGGRARTVLRLADPLVPRRVEVCDLLEEPLPSDRGGDPITPRANGAIPITLRPFQILTMRVSVG